MTVADIPYQVGAPAMEGEVSVKTAQLSPLGAPGGGCHKDLSALLITDLRQLNHIFSSCLHETCIITVVVVAIYNLISVPSACAKYITTAEPLSIDDVA